MDNNQNFGQQPPQPNNNPFGGQPVNNMNNQQVNGGFGQPQMNNGFGQQPVNNPFGNQQPPKPPIFNVLELVALICSGAGFLLTLFGTIFTCTCSAEKSMESMTMDFKLSPIFVLTIFGIIVAAAGVVIGIMALKKTDAVIKADKMAKIAIILGVASVVFGILPLLTICGYNCSLNNEVDSVYEDALGSLSDYFN